MRYVLFGLFCLSIAFLGGCSTQSSAPTAPAQLTPEEEKAILEKMNQSSQSEGTSPTTM